MNRQYELPDEMEDLIEEALKGLGFSLQQPRKLAACVQDQSDYYIQNPIGKTPWKELWAKVAQLSYYFPLNSLRALSVIDEGHRLGFFDGLHCLIDYGSGLGAGSWWLSEIEHQIYVETSIEAQDLHQKLIGEAQLRSWHRERPRTCPPKCLGLFSYSLTETDGDPDWIYDLDALMIVEPSTRQDGRRLLELRKKLIDHGFFIWSPCTHQQDCPLLIHSGTDWCHDRIHFKAPKWFLEMESQLPFKNQTLTSSYLLARKNPPPLVTGAIARVTGDRLDEKGKSRQLVCRGPDREFLSWLHKDIQPANIPRGVLIEFPEDFEKKANELRLKRDVLIKN